MESNGDQELSEPLLAKDEEEPLVRFEAEQERETPPAETDMNLGILDTTPTTESTSRRQGIHANDQAFEEDQALEVDQLWERGEMQPSKFRDAPFAVIFLFLFFAVAIHGSICLSSWPGFHSVRETICYIFDNATVLCCGIFIALFIINTALLSGFCTSQSRIEKLITFGMWVTIISSVVSAPFLYQQGIYLAGVMSTLYGAWATCYYFSVRNRIPFAASNVKCGLEAVRQNSGVFVVGALLTLVTAIWVLLWTSSMYHVAGNKHVCSEDTNPGSVCSTQYSRPGWILPYVLLLFWTAQVLQYSIHTVAAGVTASWYFTPQEAFGFCSVAVRSSVQRSLTTSFGSICLGALLVAVIQLLKVIVESLRRNRSDRNNHRQSPEDIVFCCLDCILRLAEGILQYFNKWTFVYVGIYGYNYLTAGKKVMSLFERRGWSAITDDYLCSIAVNLLGLLLLVFSVISTMLVLFILAECLEMIWFGSIGFKIDRIMIGVEIIFVLVGVVISIINSAVCTIIVCFAEAPIELDRNHGAYSREMKEAWHKAFPTLHF